MKKIYTSMVVATVAMASVAQAAPLFESGRMPVVERTKSAEITMPRKLDAPAIEIKRVDGKKKAPSTLADFAGNYVWSCYNMLSDGEGFATGEMVATIADEATNTLNIDFNNYCTGLQVDYIKAVVDLDKNEFRIPCKQYVGWDTQYDSPLYFFVAAMNEDMMGIDQYPEGSECVGTIQDNTISFPQMDIFGLGDPDDIEAGFWFLTAMNSLTFAEDLNAGWEYYCEGNYIDGWMVPVADENTILDPEKYPYTVTIEKYADIPSRYRILNPYSTPNFPFADMLYAEDGYIVFDISDPEFVCVEPYFSSGVISQNGYICMTNVEGFYYYHLQNDMTKETLKEALLSEYPDLTFSSYSDKTVVFKNCQLCFSGDQNCYSWGKDVEPYMHGSLVFSKEPENNYDAVETVISENAPIEYFNAQGVRVSADTKGLVIVRQGDQSRKLINK